MKMRTIYFAVSATSSKRWQARGASTEDPVCVFATAAPRGYVTRKLASEIGSAIGPSHSDRSLMVSALQYCTHTARIPTDYFA